MEATTILTRGEPHRAVVRTVRLELDGLCRLGGRGGRLGLLRHHQRAQFGIRCQHAVEPDQVQPWPWHQRREPLHELQRRHHQVRGAVAPGGLELEHHLASGIRLHAF